MNFLKVKNWESFQHYKDREPPWIKLHRGLLTDYQFSCLQDASKLHLMLIWLLASQTGNKIPADPKYLRNILQLDETPNLKELIDKGFLYIEQVASDALADCNQVAMPEAEAEAEAEAEKHAVKTALPISGDWMPNTRSKAFIAEYGLTVDQAMPAIRDFIRYFQEVEKKAKNWDLSFQRNPVVKSNLAKIKREVNHNGTHKRSSSAADRAAGQAEIDKAIIAEALGCGDLRQA